ncbi:hypothetical protein [Arachidicoccus soli]|uniref:Uncharacterized protein n=1 Tax=Arachidicoccus soli TaxID=2341117 RepID=A0A386HQG9_9BACT|nr:hypothetical protein [Arachidicoccus soli]AYD48188.1 hypothetical protein D6B99_11630 [Arachidicoccus soli]
MPPINPTEIIKDVLPEKLNPEAAVENLSKTQSGALYIVSLCIVVPLLALIIWLAINNANGSKADRDNAAIKYDAQITALQNANDSLRNANQDLHDSLFKTQIINQFNITSGAKQIILTPKKSTK